jgi:hypothetical protein
MVWKADWRHLMSVSGLGACCATAADVAITMAAMALSESSRRFMVSAKGVGRKGESCRRCVGAAILQGLIAAFS